MQWLNAFVGMQARYAYNKIIFMLLFGNASSYPPFVDVLPA